MNANKIAEELENINWVQGDGTVKPFQHYANFVRQQQAEIEDLKAKLQLHEAMDNQCASLMQQFRKAQEK